MPLEPQSTSDLNDSEMQEIGLNESQSKKQLLTGSDLKRLWYKNLTKNFNIFITLLYHRKVEIFFN